MWNRNLLLQSVAYLLSALALFQANVPYWTLPGGVGETGWPGSEQQPHLAEPIAARMPVFRLELPFGAPPQDNSRRRVVLWAWDQQACGQKFLPHYPQQTSDCTSFAVRRALIVRLAWMVGNGEPIEWKDVDPPFQYACARVLVGQRQLGRQGGAFVTWYAESLRTNGIAWSEWCPPYSGQRADAWGWSGPPRDLLDKARQYTGDAARVETPEQVTDAICNGYPCPFGSSHFGANRFRKLDGRIVALN